MEENKKVCYWEFVEQHYPNYFNCDKILESNLLLVKIENLKPSKKFIKRQYKLNKKLLKVDRKILSKALENYFKNMHQLKTT
jgi:hypothetical protein